MAFLATLISQAHCLHSRRHHHRFPLWSSYLQTHPLEATCMQPQKILSLIRKSDHPAPVLKTSLWLPTAQRIISDATKFRSKAFQALAHRTLFPTPSHLSLLPHLSSTVCSSAPRSFQAPRQTSVILTSSLEYPSAPLPMPTPTCYSGLILGFTSPREPTCSPPSRVGCFFMAPPVPGSHVFGK